VRYSATILEVVGPYARIMFGDLLARTYLRMHPQGMLLHAGHVVSTLRISLSGMAPTWHLTRDNVLLSRVRIVGTHTLRHTFALRSLRGSGEVVKVSKLLGHAALSTTQRYVDHLETRELKEAVPLLPT